MFSPAKVRVTPPDTRRLGRSAPGAAKPKYRIKAANRFLGNRRLLAKLPDIYRVLAQRWLDVCEGQALRRHVKSGNIVAAGIHDKQPMMILAEENAALIAEPPAGAADRCHLAERPPW